MACGWGSHSKYSKKETSRTSIRPEDIETKDFVFCAGQTFEQLTNSTKLTFYVVKQEIGKFFRSLPLCYKSEEDVGAAGEQLISNRIYDGEYRFEAPEYRGFLGYSLS